MLRCVVALCHGFATEAIWECFCIQNCPKLPVCSNLNNMQPDVFNERNT